MSNSFIFIFKLEMKQITIGGFFSYVLMNRCWESWAVWEHAKALAAAAAIKGNCRVWGDYCQSFLACEGDLSTTLTHQSPKNISGEACTFLGRRLCSDKDESNLKC